MVDLREGPKEAKAHPHPYWILKSRIMDIIIRTNRLSARDGGIS